MRLDQKLVLWVIVSNVIIPKQTVAMKTFERWQWLIDQTIIFRKKIQEFLLLNYNEGISTIYKMHSLNKYNFLSLLRN